MYKSETLLVWKSLLRSPAFNQIFPSGVRRMEFGVLLKTCKEIMSSVLIFMGLLGLILVVTTVCGEKYTELGFSAFLITVSAGIAVISFSFLIAGYHLTSQLIPSWMIALIHLGLHLASIILAITSAVTVIWLWEDWKGLPKDRHFYKITIICIITTAVGLTLSGWERKCSVNKILQIPRKVPLCRGTFTYGKE